MCEAILDHPAPAKPPADYRSAGFVQTKMVQVTHIIIITDNLKKTLSHYVLGVVCYIGKAKL